MLKKFNESRSNALKQLCQKFDLIDVWRIQHPGILEFTCVSITSCGPVVSRLDYFLLSQDLMPIVGECNILSNGGGDHDVISIVIQPQVDSKRVFRFPSSLLKDDNFRNLLSFNVDTLVRDNAGASARTMWEIVKCCIRSTASKYTFDRKKSREDRIVEIEKRLATLKRSIFDGQFSLQFNRDVKREITLLLDLRDSLFVDEENEKLMSNWQDAYGNKGTSNKKFFRRIRDEISFIQVCELRDHNDIIRSSREEVLNIARDFYDDLYRYRPVLTPDSPADMFLPRISRAESDYIDSPFEFDEFWEALKELKKGKTPGNDGLTVEFYLSFWPIVGHIMFNAICEAVEYGEMGPSLRRGIIKLIPKKGKDLLHITNWRGICLLNVDYKIFSKVIANRVGVLLSKIIHPDQKAFIPGRYMSNAMYDLYAVQNIVDEEQLDVLLESLDIHKAFDSLSWEFLQYCYSQFGFSTKFISLLKCLYKNREVFICNNGFLSSKIVVGRGCPQGDCLSPINFIVAIEILASRIRYNDNILPVSVFDVTKKLNMVADDVLLMYHNTHAGCQQISHELNMYRNNSGLFINNQKCAIMRIGRNKNVCLSDNRRRDIPRCQKGFKYIGVKYMMDHEEMTRVTFNEKFKEIKLALFKRSLALRQEPLVSKTYALSSLYYSRIRYFLNILPMMSDQMCKKFQTEFQYAMWGDNRHKVNIETSAVPVKQGGLGSMDVSLLSIAYKAYATKFIFLHDDDAPQFWQLQLASAIKFDLRDIIKGNLQWKSLNNHCLSIPRFWRDCMRSWCRFHYGNYTSEKFHVQEIFSRPVFLNSMVGTGKAVVNCDLYKHNECLENYQLYTIYDLLNVDLQTIPTARNEKSCICRKTIRTMQSKVPKRVRNVRRTCMYTTIAKRACDQNLSLKEIVMILQVKTIKKMYSRWDKYEVTMSEEKWSALCKNIHIFVNKSVKTYFLLSNLRAYWYRADTSRKIKNSPVSEECRLCKKHFESWKHVYMECEFTRVLWSKLELDLPFKYKSIVNQESIFAPCNIPVEMVIIIVLTKYFIHLCLFLSNMKPQYNFLIHHIIFHCKASLNHAKREGRSTVHYWNNVLEIFNPP